MGIAVEFLLTNLPQLVATLQGSLFELRLLDDPTYRAVPTPTELSKGAPATGDPWCSFFICHDSVTLLTERALQIIMPSLQALVACHRNLRLCTAPPWSPPSTGSAQIPSEWDFVSIEDVNACIQWHFAEQSIDWFVPSTSYSGGALYPSVQRTTENTAAFDRSPSPAAGQPGQQWEANTASHFRPNTNQLPIGSTFWPPTWQRLPSPFLQPILLAQWASFPTVATIGSFPHLVHRSVWATQITGVEQHSQLFDLSGNTMRALCYLPKLAPTD